MDIIPTLIMAAAVWWLAHLGGLQLSQLPAYRRWRGGRWARVTGFLFRYRWVQVGPNCVERVDEDYS